LDVIQGTGSVILAGWLSALKAQGTDPKECRVLFYGAGSAAVG
jgi:malic enzyme